MTSDPQNGLPVNDNTKEETIEFGKGVVDGKLVTENASPAGTPEGGNPTATEKGDGGNAARQKDDPWLKLQQQRAWITLFFSAISLFLLYKSVVIIATLIAEPTLPSPQRCNLILGVVTLTGAVGGSVSMVRRLQAIRRNCDLSSLGGTGIQLWTAGFASSVNGAIFSIVLYLIFLGGLISGALFPTFPEAAANATNNGALPETPQALAKLLVFAFLAGFAERLVPDALDRLIKSSEDADTKNRTEAQKNETKNATVTQEGKKEERAAETAKA